jgi:hypothetical protein
MRRVLAGVLLAAAAAAASAESRLALVIGNAAYSAPDAALANPVNDAQAVGEALRRLDERRAPLVFLEGDPGYYSRLGFLSGDQLGFTAPSVRIPGPAFQVATLTGYDRTTMTGALVYPDVFWRHDCVGVRPEH